MATKTFNTRIANKRDTSANWTSNNPVLLNGEVIIVDTEAGQVRYKVGNGTSTYTQLPFTDESLITNINGKLSLSGGTMTGNIDMGGHKLTGLGAPVNPNDAVRQTDLKVVSDEVDGIISGTTGITLAPATTTKIGGVIVGDGIDVEADGTISTNPVPAGGTTGQVLTKTSTGEEWSDAPSGLPDGGTEGQMLYKSADGAEWGDKPVMYVNITKSGGTYSADKTFAEIQEHYTSGFAIYAAYQYEVEYTVPLGYLQTNYSATFVLDYGGSYIRIQVYVNGTVNVNISEVSASDISFTPTSTLTSDNVQDAIEEVYTKTAPTHQTITLSSSAWSSNSQTVAVSGVTADELAQLITPTPAIASQSAYYEAGIMCTNQGTNSLTFTCQTVPTSNLTVYVVIQPLS